MRVVYHGTHQPKTPTPKTPNHATTDLEHRPLLLLRAHGRRRDALLVVHALSPLRLLVPVERGADALLGPRPRRQDLVGLARLLGLHLRPHARLALENDGAVRLGLGLLLLWWGLIRAHTSIGRSTD